VAALGAHHCSSGAASSNRPALALCTDNLTCLNKRNASLCLHLLHLLLREPSGAAFAESKVIARAVQPLSLIAADVTVVASLTTLCTNLLSSTGILECP